jgi:diguanylate cyclase (GGDEF)-like protein/PAS domain S-box-containing protein
MKAAGKLYLSLAQQTALASVLLSLLAVVLVSGLHAVLRGRQIRDELGSKAVLYTTQLRRQLAPVIAFDDAATAREVFESLALDPDVAGLAAYSATGEVIDGVGRYPHHMSATEAPDGSEHGLIIVFGRVTSSEGVSGQLYVSLSKARIRRARLAMLEIGSAAALVAFLIALALAIPIAAHLTRRLSRIVDRAACIARGDFTLPPLETHTRDEIGLMALAVNKISTELRRMFDELGEMHEARHLRNVADQAKLEALVAERTATLQESRAEAKALAARFEVAADAAGLGVWEWDLFRNSLLWDEQMYRLYGLTRQDPIAQFSQWTDHLQQDDRGRVEREIVNALQRDSRFESEFRAVRPSGEICHLSAAARVQRDASGAPLRMVGITLDITKRKVAEQGLQESERNFRSLFDLSPIGMALIDKSMRFLQVNDAFALPTGYSRAELLRMTIRDITPSHDGLPAIESALDSIQFGPFEMQQLRKDDTAYAVLTSGLRMKDASGHDVVWIIGQDISQRKEMESKLIDAARRDKLTGLANRALFMERLEEAVARVRRGQQHNFAVLFLDFDRFKLVNDTIGHDGGDELLRQISGRLQRQLRAADALSADVTGTVVSRFGGDEFLILINDLNRASDASGIAERLLKALTPVYEILGNEVNSSASIGIVTSEQCNTNAADVVRDADVAMYEAKRAGRSCCVVFNDVMQAQLRRRVLIETSLRHAIGTPELYLLYQPIVDLASGNMVSTEALLRWNHPTLGAITPSEFIPIAEESGTIVALGQWVQKEACRALARWRQQDLLQAPKTVSVNISRAELALGTQLLDQLREILESTALPAQCLQLEITEREVMRQPDSAHKVLRELQSLGVQIAMDDFGTGTSSLSVLRNFSFDTIKIDRAFVQDLSASTHEVLAVIHATISLIENLGMVSLAEGVEEPAQVAILQSLGCRYAQGYLFSHPVPPEQLLNALSAQATREDTAA